MGNFVSLNYVVIEGLQTKTKTKTKLQCKSTKLFSEITHFFSTSEY